MKRLTKMQEAVFEFLKNYLGKHGYPPTIREIGEHFRILWPAARQHLRALEKKGFIRLNASKSRGIDILGTRRLMDGLIPVAGRIKAGEPSFAVEEIDMHIAVDPQLFPQTDTFALRVRGDSMRDAGIFDGDFVIVKKQNTIEHGEIGVILIGDEATIKRVLFEKEKIILKPENITMSPVAYSPYEVSIIGKVIGLIRNRI
ncbi:MAG: transcriptional repressor LexA [Syntrophorhabdaceae bacterium]|nr:transcriptional repressor LexA [Syntrophorhabdaceae bacterium]